MSQSITSPEALIRRLFGSKSPVGTASIGAPNPSGQVRSRGLSQGNVIYTNRNAASPTGNTKPTAIEQLGGLLFEDVAETERVQKQNYDNTGKAIADFGDFVTKNTQAQLDAAKKADELLGGSAARMRDQAGDDLATYDKNAADAVATADKWANEAVLRANENITETEDRQGLDMSAALLGLRSRMRDEGEMDALDENGNMRTPAQLADAKNQRDERYTNAIASAHIQIGSDYNRLGAQLRSELTNMTLAAGNLAVGTRLQTTTGRLQAEQGRREYENMAATLDRVRAVENTAVVTSALQAELAGRGQIAQWTIDNKFSAIAKAGAFAQLLAAASAPGAAQVPGFEPTEQGGLRFNSPFAGVSSGGGGGYGGDSGEGDSSREAPQGTPQFGLGSFGSQRSNLGSAPDRGGLSAKRRAANRARPMAPQNPRYPAGSLDGNTGPVRFA